MALSNSTDKKSEQSSQDKAARDRAQQSEDALDNVREGYEKPIDDTTARPEHLSPASGGRKTPAD